MADDQFTATMEWLLRIRREHGDVLSLLRRVRKYHLTAYSTQDHRDIRRWATPEAEQIYDDLERLLTLLDPSLGKYLQGTVVQHNGYLPKGTMGAVDLNSLVPGSKPAIEDKRPVKGPGRRYGFIRRTQP